MVLLLVLISALNIEAQRMEIDKEARAFDLLKSFEFTSYNLLFDLCSYLKTHENFISLEEASQGIPQLIERWCSQINNGSKTKEVYSPTVRVESVLVEEYSGQPVDSYQMRFAGEKGDEAWLVSGKLYIEFWNKGILFRADFTIRLAV